MTPRWFRRKTRSGAGAVRAGKGSPRRAMGFRTRTELLVFALGFALLVAMVTKPPELGKPEIGYDIDSSPVALEEVRAEIYFESEIRDATQAKRDAAAATVPDTYRVDNDRVQRQLRLLDERTGALRDKRGEVEQAVREALAQSDSSQEAGDVVMRAVTDYAAQLKGQPEFEQYPDSAILATWLTPALDALPERRFEAGPDESIAEAPGLSVAELEAPQQSDFAFARADTLVRLAREGLEYVLSNGVVRSAASPENAKRTIIVIRENPVGDQTVSDELPLGEVPGVADAVETLNARIIESAKAAAKGAGNPVDWAQLQTAAFEMARPYVTYTLFFDQVYTEGARQRARREVAHVLKEWQPPEVIQRSGDRWTAQSRSDVRTYWAALEAQQTTRLRLPATLAAHVILVALVLACLRRSFVFLAPKRQEGARTLYLALLVMCTTVVLGRVVWYFEPTGFVLPTAAGAILLAILVNARVAVMTGTLTALLVSIQFGYDWRLLLVGAAMSVGGVFGMYRVRKRGDMTRAPLRAAIVGLLVVVAISLALDPLASESALRRLSLVLLNGVACVFIVPGVLSPLERLFGITTDIQLIEYSDLNNEVLSRMAIEMPATYAHSLMLGQLAEAAADAIGANGLLARVCAYYHDIGKLRRPEYFCENQNGVNVHDELPPRLSARAIASHVAAGIEMAREYHLPKPIIDGILEHHGTNQSGFFYQQAVKLDKHDDVQEEDFRYPGPKPQSRESAILMICDAVESGVRSIKNPNEDRVREFVDKIIQGRSADRQFDECALTLKDLDVIKEAVTRRMVTALHTRIAYPDKEPQRQVANVVSITGGGA